jgi:hypothetical protein
VTDHRAAKDLDGRVLLDHRELSQARRLWKPRHHAALGTVGSLLDPAAEPQTRALDEVKEFGDRVGTVPRVEQRVGERGLLAKVRRLAQQHRQRMISGQLAECNDEIANPGIGRANTEASTELLQHVDPDAAVRRIHHQMHGAVRLECLAQRGKARVGVLEMMQHTGADDLIEAGPQLVDTLDRQLADFQIRQAVRAAKLLGTADAGLADVDRDHLRVGPAYGVPGGLRCATAGHEDGKVVPIGFGRPEEVVVSETPMLIEPELSVRLKARDGPRIGIPVVEVADLCGHRAFGKIPGGRAGRRGCATAFHVTCGRRPASAPHPG